jgi:hypothetical protein
VIIRDIVGAFIQGGLIVVLLGGTVLIAGALWAVGRGKR